MEILLDELGELHPANTRSTPTAIRTKNPSPSITKPDRGTRSLQFQTLKNKTGGRIEREDREEGGGGGGGVLPVAGLSGRAHQLVAVEHHHLVLVGLVDQDALHRRCVGGHHREVAADDPDNALHHRRRRRRRFVWEVEPGGRRLRTRRCEKKRERAGRREKRCIKELSSLRLRVQERIGVRRAEE